VRVVRALIAIALVLGAARAEASKGCHEVSDVVGRQKCTFFGTWSRDAAVPALWLEVGFLERSFDAMPFNLDKSTALLERDPKLATTMYGTTMRMLMGSILYGGLELDAAWDGALPEAQGAIQPKSGLYMGSGAVFGAHVALWRVGFGAEVLAGGRVAGFSPCTNSKDCSDSGELQARWLLDVRARVDLFAAPRFSIGAVIGHSLIDAHDTTLMITLGAHIRALDGMP
jgi:hypothetical protein